ncbi:MAG: DUF58 domain-containing protein [Gammaproteobacteria bacterium]
MNELADRPVRVPDEFIGMHWWRLFRWFANLRAVPRRDEYRARIVSRALRRYFYDGLTRPGKILFFCSLFVFLFSYRIGSDFLLSSAAVGASILAWSVILGLIYQPRVTVMRVTPDTAVAGKELVSNITVQNNSRLGLFNFVTREMLVPYCNWPREWLRPHRIALAPGQRCSVAVSFEPQRRGKLTLSGIAVQSYFPFFLTRFTQRIPQAHDVYVLPPTFPIAIPSLRHVAEQATKRLKLGTDNSRRGPSLEYAYSRQYQTGDSLRRMDHRASSRQAKPMSKVFEGADEIRRDQVYLMVDLTLADFLPWQRRPKKLAALDSRLALAVEIGLSATNEGFSLAALATGSAWHNLKNISEFYRRIATCQAERTLDYDGAPFPESSPNPDGLHIMVVGKWSAAKQSLLDRWHKAGILTLVFMVPESADDVESLPVGSQFVEIDLPGAEK